MTSKCNRCDADIIWGEYDAGKPSRPMNPDGTIHVCMKQNPEPTPNTKESSKTPEKTPNTILLECLEFSETFKDITDAKFDSLVRLYNTRVMQR